MPEVQALRTHLVTELRGLLDAEHLLTKDQLTDPDKINHVLLLTDVRLPVQHTRMRRRGLLSQCLFDFSQAFLDRSNAGSPRLSEFANHLVHG